MNPAVLMLVFAGLLDGLAKYGVIPEYHYAAYLAIGWIIGESRAKR